MLVSQEPPVSEWLMECSVLLPCPIFSPKHLLGFRAGKHSRNNFSPKTTNTTRKIEKETHWEIRASVSKHITSYCKQLWHIYIYVAFSSSLTLLDQCLVGSYVLKILSRIMLIQCEISLQNRSSGDTSVMSCFKRGNDMSLKDFRLGGGAMPWDNALLNQ